MKNLRKNSILLLLITAVVVGFVLKDDFPDIMKALMNSNLLYLFIALCIFAVGLLFEAKAYQEIIEEYNHSYTLMQAYKMLIITKFFNGITPFSSGGQPMQVYLLKRDGIRITKATNIIIQNFIIYQAALVTVGIFAVVVNYFNPIFHNATLLKHLVRVGFIMNTLVMIGLIIVSVSSRFNHFILRKTIWLLDRLHLIKGKDKVLARWEERVDDFHEGTDYLKRNPMLCVRTYFYNIIYLILVYSMPFFVVLGLNHGAMEGVTVLKVIVANAYVAIMGAFVPIPGASGGIEFGYFKFFGNFIKGPLLKASLLLWRTISYYIPMVVGGILFSAHMKRDDKSCE